MNDTIVELLQARSKQMGQAVNASMAAGLAAKHAYDRKQIDFNRDRVTDAETERFLRRLIDMDRGIELLFEDLRIRLADRGDAVTQFEDLVEQRMKDSL